MANISNKRKKKRFLMKQQRGLCWLCGNPMSNRNATFDHVVPRGAGGGSALGNLKLAHGACNHKRGREVGSVFIEHDGIVALRWNVRSVGFL